VKKYTSGVLSFAEADLPPGQREKLMASFERVLMPGLDKDQYSILWVEHADKGRLELNFLIPNTELLTGTAPAVLRPRRPAAHRCLADHRERQTGAARPERAGKPPGAGHAVRTAENEAGGRRSHYRGLLSLASSGELKSRQDVTEALEGAGFEVVRTTKSSISIADPDGGETSD
jgi:hypothetical protein